MALGNGDRHFIFFLPTEQTRTYPVISGYKKYHHNLVNGCKCFYCTGTQGIFLDASLRDSKAIPIHKRHKLGLDLKMWSNDTFCSRCIEN